MIMAEYRRAAAARVAVRPDQDRRVNLEPALRFGRDIGGGHYRGDGLSLPEQQAANFPRRAGLRRVQYGFDKLS